MAIHKTPSKGRTIRKGSKRRSPSPADTGVGDSDRIRLPSVQRGASEPTPSRYDTDSLARAKADFIRRIKRYHSTRGRVSQEKDFRFQPIINRDTHERIHAARRRLKDGPLLVPFRPSEIPKAVAVDFTRLHAHNCKAYEVIKNGKRKKN